MALSLRGTAESTAGVDPTVTHPGSIANGDVVIYAVVTGASSNQDLSMITTGYTELADLYANDGFDTNLGVFRKVMGASPDSSAQAETGSTVGMAVEHVWSGVDTTTPEDATTTTVTTTNTARSDPPSITTVTADAVVIAICGSAYYQSATLSEPTGYSNIVDVGDSGTSIGHVMMASKAVASPGAENPGIFNGFNNGVGDTSASGAAASVALRPAAGGAKTLSLASVAWSWSVTAVSLERGREVVPDTVAWTWAVQDVTFNKGKTLALDSVAWSWAAQDVSLEHGKEIVPANAAWSWSITDAALEKGWEVVPASVAWAYTVSDASLEHGFEIVPDSVSWSWSVTDTTFTLLAERTIAPESVAWSWSVADVSLELGREIVPESLAWQWNATDATFTAGATEAIAPIRPGGGLPQSYEEWLRETRKEARELREEDAPSKVQEIVKIGPAQPKTEARAFIPSPSIETGLSELTKSEIRRRARLAKKRRQEDDWFLLN